MGQRVFAVPAVANSLRRLHLWIDSDGSGFIRSDVVDVVTIDYVRDDAVFAS
ncbi:MAG: hypothetical protein ACXVAF_06465 [Vulcanimicrobiaceae bacterium]